jgi:hypothetical protein
MPEYNLVISWFDQLITLISGFIIKPTYMILAGVLIFRMHTVQSKDLRYIWYSLIGFFMGEFICAVNYYVASGTNDVLEVIHGLGMVWMWIFLPWGLFLFIDERLIHFSAPEVRCALHNFCVHCRKKEPYPCGVQQLFLFFAIALVLITLIPLTHPLNPYEFVISIFDEPTWFVSRGSVQVIELFIYSALAAILFITSMVVLKTRNETRPATYYFFTGFGFMSFSLFRFFFTFTFEQNPVWSNFWEETTELILVVGVAIFLWIFHEQFAIRGTIQIERNS